jgi:hypothetical protein
MPARRSDAVASFASNAHFKIDCRVKRHDLGGWID